MPTHGTIGTGFSGTNRLLGRCQTPDGLQRFQTPLRRGQTPDRLRRSRDTCALARAAAAAVEQGPRACNITSGCTRARRGEVRGDAFTAKSTAGQPEGGRGRSSLLVMCNGSFKRSRGAQEGTVDAALSRGARSLLCTHCKSACSPPLFSVRETMVSDCAGYVRHAKGTANAWIRSVPALRAAYRAGTADQRMTVDTFDIMCRKRYRDDHPLPKYVIDPESTDSSDSASDDSDDD
jgi:hypothetical protein